MRINLAMWDRILRFVIGVIMGIWALAGGPFWAMTGFYLITTSAWGYDPVYSLLKLSSAKTESRRSVPPE